nr:hypothetical protein [Mycobacterium decipiens]
MVWLIGDLRVDGTGGRFLAVQPLPELGLLLTNLGFPPIELGLLVVEFGLSLGEAGFALSELGFKLAELIFVLVELVFLLVELVFLLVELVCVLAELVLVLTQLHFIMTERGFPLGDCGFTLSESLIAVDELGVAIAEFGLLVDVSGQLVLDQVDEEIDLLLAITALANAWARERDVVNVSWSQHHCSSPRVCGGISTKPRIALCLLPSLRWCCGSAAEILGAEGDAEPTSVEPGGDAAPISPGVDRARDKCGKKGRGCFQEA